MVSYNGGGYVLQPAVITSGSSMLTFPDIRGVAHIKINTSFAAGKHIA
jgi:hypothetical protein